MNWFDDWALTLAVFLPLVGVVIIGLIPKANEELHKIVALVTALVTFAVGIGILLGFDFDNTSVAQFEVDLAQRLAEAAKQDEAPVGFRVDQNGRKPGTTPDKDGAARAIFGI